MLKMLLFQFFLLIIIIYYCFTYLVFQASLVMLTLLKCQGDTAETVRRRLEERLALPEKEWEKYRYNTAAHRYVVGSPHPLHLMENTLCYLDIVGTMFLLYILFKEIIKEEVNVLL